MSKNVCRDSLLNLPLAIFVADGSGVIKDVNEAACLMTGYAKSELLGTLISQLIQGVDGQSVRDYLAQCQGKPTSDLILNFFGKSGIERPVKMQVVCLADDEYVGCVQDLCGPNRKEDHRSPKKIKYKLAFDESPVAKAIVSISDHSRVEVNPAFCKMLGYTQEEFVNGGWLKITHPEDREESNRRLNELVTGQKNKQLYQKRYIKKDGSVLWAEVHHSIHLDPETKERYFLSVVLDISEQLLAARAIRESAEKFRKLFEESPVAKLITNMADQIDANRAFCKMLGYEKEELAGVKWQTITHPDDYILSDQASDHLLSNQKQEERFSKRYIKKDGSPIWVDLYLSLHKDDEGNPQYFLSEIIDITNRRDVEKALQEQKVRYQASFENTNLAMGYYKTDGTVVALNKRAAELYGGLPEDFIGKSIYEIQPKAFAEINMERLQTAARSEHSQVYEWEVPYVGRSRWFSTTFSKVLGPEGNLQFIQTTSIEITERVQVEQSLEESELRYQALFENSGITTQYLSPDGIILSQNKKVASYMDGVPSDFIGKSIYDVFPKDHCDGVMQRIRIALISEEPQQYENQVHLPKGKMWFSNTYSRVLDEDGQVLAVQVVGVNIEDKKQAEEEKKMFEAHLSNQQKLEAIGTLASGVAHEINNPINGILNYGQIILDTEIEDPSVKEYAQEIIHETNRVARIVRNLLEFSRQTDEGASYAEIGDIVEKTMSLITTVLRHDQIEIKVDLATDLPRIRCRSQQIEQILMNLITNARDALNEKYQGYHENKKINISGVPFEEDSQKWIRLTVEDFGAGLAEDLLDRIFEPFFTTKDRTKGTGLGLYIIQRIIKEHKGSIRVQSEKGKYTRFIIDLPC